mmetsp:Transcript_55118/g.129400  ORF Transcript_55118/g.129400 Transcript_55118/m.129400 type:complete len:201 (-) Transcript_55118:137-739(-)
MLPHWLGQNPCRGLVLVGVFLPPSLCFLRFAMALPLLLLPELLLLISSFLLLLQDFLFCCAEFYFGLPLLVKLRQLQGVDFLASCNFILDALYLSQLLSQLGCLFFGCSLGPFFSGLGCLVCVLLFIVARGLKGGLCCFSLGLRSSLSVFVLLFLFGLLRGGLLTHEQLHRSADVLVRLHEGIAHLVVAELWQDVLHLAN